MSPTRIRKLKQVLDVIAIQLSPESEAIGTMLRFMGHAPITIPYNHFPSSLEASEVNELLSKLANYYHLIDDLQLEKDQVSFSFPARLTKKKFEDFRNSVSDACKADQNKEFEAKRKEERKEKLYFSKDGNTEYRGQTYKFSEKTKAWAMLYVLSNNPSYAHSLKEIKEDCNKHIARDGHKFRKRKDVNDTLSYIRKKLEVEEDEYFPIQRRIKGEQPTWILLQR